MAAGRRIKATRGRVDTRQSIEARKRRKRQRRRRRMIQAWIARVLALEALILVLALIVRGGMALWGRFFDSSGTFAGARMVGESGRLTDSLLIVVDAGHGGKDQGTCAGNILEKDINLAVATKLADVLEENGAMVIMTRTEDVKVELEERANIANEQNADIFVSIHCNYYEDSEDIKGFECYYQESSEEAQELAERIVESLESIDSVENRGMKTADYRVLRKTNMQAVLIELGYLSNPGECRKLTDEDYQDLLVEQIASAILQTD